MPQPRTMPSVTVHSRIWMWFRRRLRVPVSASCFTPIIIRRSMTKCTGSKIVRSNAAPNNEGEPLLGHERRAVSSPGSPARGRTSSCRPLRDPPKCRSPWSRIRGRVRADRRAGSRTRRRPPDRSGTSRACRRAATPDGELAAHPPLASGSPRRSRAGRNCRSRPDPDRVVPTRTTRLRLARGW